MHEVFVKRSGLTATLGHRYLSAGTCTIFWDWLFCFDLFPHRVQMNSVLASPLHSRWHRTMMVVPSSVSKTSYRSPSGWISLSLQVGHAIFLFLWSALSLATIVWSMVLSISRSSSIVFMTSAKRNKIELCHSHYVLISQSFSTRGKYVGRIRRAKVVAVIIMYDMEARSLGAKRRQIRFLRM